MNLYILSIFVIGSYIIQTFFSIRQTKQFHELFNQLHQRGKVLVGKDIRRIRKGTIVIVCFNDEEDIRDCYVMHGRSVKARFHPYRIIYGYNLKKLEKLINDGFIDKKLSVAFKKMTIDYNLYKQEEKIYGNIN